VSKNRHNRTKAFARTANCLKLSQGVIFLRISRRQLLQSGAVLAAAPLVDLAAGPPEVAAAQPPAPDLVWRHGLSLFGDLKYPADFARFDYVNPGAPKTGTVRLMHIGTFDNFNPVISGVKGALAAGTELVFESLTKPALDEEASAYGLLAQSFAYPEDRSWVIYRLRPTARWHDGKPVTPDDVIFSFAALKQNSPMYRGYYRHVVTLEKVGEHDVKFTFDGAGNRELPMIVGEFPVLPKHWWAGTDAQGRQRDITATMLEAPLGSGPYRVKEFDAGRSILLERVPDYWGANVAARVGQNNFAQVHYDYSRDDTVSLEAFKGDQFDWIGEASANRWHTFYDFPAVKDGRVIKETFPTSSLGLMQGYAFNLRRPLFADVRLRRAFNYAYDFEEQNRQLSFGDYQRDNSYFDGTELASSGLPEGKELEILETLRDKVPPEVFTTPYKNPVGGSAEAMRGNLREAARLLKEAGFEIRDRKLVGRDGKPVSVEFLIQDPGYEKGLGFYKPNLERLGIASTIRLVDSVQYQNRVRSFDFDIITTSWPQSISPGNEQRDFFSSQAADIPGTRNRPGIKNPAVDALIDRIIFAKDREELVAACRAMDRVLLWNFYVVPQFNIPYERYARWDRFSHPDPLPKYGISAFPDIWWWDADKAAKTGKRS
jgi:microcin C transport system substrate-binding protein